jgi:hypothetical protein
MTLMVSPAWIAAALFAAAPPEVPLPDDASAAATAAAVAATSADAAADTSPLASLTSPSIPPSPAGPLAIDPAEGGGSPWRSAALFAGGSLAAFLLHESGHVAANLAFGNTPHLEPASFAGAVPFFTIASGIHCSGDRCTRPGGSPFGPGNRGLFTILMAGFHVQHATNELILSFDPGLRHECAPFRKGMLAFNTLTSVGYVVANWSGVEPEQGDLRGAYGEVGAPRHLVNALLLGIAGLDLARYAFPDARWLAWVSRAAKVGLGGVTFTF